MKLTRLPLSLLFVAVSLLTACSREGAVDGAAVYDMTGRWSFQVRVGDTVTQGDMTLLPAAEGYTGTLTTNQGDNILPVQSLLLAGEDIVMTVTSPQGAVVFRGTLDPASETFSGKVTYHDGHVFPMLGRRINADDPVVQR